jgi:PAS domain S-box-containing protein
LPRDFHEVRAEIWRFAALPDISERELIQRLLDTVGPAFEVDRACFNEPDTDGMQCTLEWVADGIKPSLGARLPRVVQNQLVRPHPLEITLESSIQALPAWLRPLGTPVLAALGAALDLESVAIVPYSVAGGVVDGVLSFDICRGRPAPRGWSERLLPVIYEVALIVGQAIARRRAEAAQTASEKRFQTLVENLGEGVARLGPDETFVFANRASDQIFGVAPGGLVGRQLSDFLEAPWSATATASSYELVITRPDGQKRFLEVSATPEFGDSGACAATAAILRDVTEQKAAELERRRIEQYLQRSQKLESLGVLAGGIAHDFNNALMGMLAHAELVLQLLPEGHEARDSAEQIRCAALHSSGLSRQILTFSGKASAAVESLDLSSVVAETTSLMRAAMSRKAELRLELDPGLPAIEADATQLRQVAMNLLTNASESLGEHSGEIVVSTLAISLDPGALQHAQVGADIPAGNFVCLEVADTGCGMSAAQQAQMFDPFFSTRFTGRGLGLAAVLGIVRTHRGAIFVDSAPGKGTRMRVCLPSSDRPVSPAVVVPRTLVSRSEAEAITVLLVDDDVAVLSSVRRLLSRSGFVILSAADGRAAIDTYRQHAGAISLVLMDMTMPELGGSEVLAELRIDRPELPVILCSGHDEEDLDLHPGVNTAFLHKPFEHHTLLATIRGLLSGHR